MKYPADLWRILRWGQPRPTGNPTRSCWDGKERGPQGQIAQKVFLLSHYGNTGATKNKQVGLSSNFGSSNFGFDFSCKSVAIWVNKSKMCSTLFVVMYHGSELQAQKTISVISFHYIFFIVVVPTILLFLIICCLKLGYFSPKRKKQLIVLGNVAASISKLWCYNM